MNLKHRSILYTVLSCAAVFSAFFINRGAAGYIIALVLFTAVSLALSFDKKYREYKNIRIPVWCTVSIMALLWVFAILEFLGVIVL